MILRLGEKRERKEGILKVPQKPRQQDVFPETFLEINHKVKKGKMNRWEQIYYHAFMDSKEDYSDI